VIVGAHGRAHQEAVTFLDDTLAIAGFDVRVADDDVVLFAGVDDKRIRSTASPNNDKILVLKGTSIFAGVDIRSY